MLLFLLQIKPLNFPNPSLPRSRQSALRYGIRRNRHVAPATTYIRGKDKDGFDLRLLDSTGAIVEGLVDVVAVGY